jgi:hypothetical protein
MFVLILKKKREDADARLLWANSIVISRIITQDEIVPPVYLLGRVVLLVLAVPVKRN